MPCPHEYINFKVLWNQLHILNLICKSYEIKFLLLAAYDVTSLIVCRHGVGWGGDNDCHHHGTNPNTRG